MSTRQDRYPIPDDVAARLSSSDLGDVPKAVVAWSPGDASDRDVRRTLGTYGYLPPGTNFGVVYRACFEPLLIRQEEPLHLRVAFASSAVGEVAPAGDVEQAWLLLTDRRVRWHVFTDRVPGMPPRNPIEAVAPPVREVFYKEGVGVVATGIREGPGGMPVRALQLQAAHGTNDRWYHSFVIADDPSTDALIDHLMRRSGG